MLVFIGFDSSVVYVVNLDTRGVTKKLLINKLIRNTTSHQHLSHKTTVKVYDHPKKILERHMQKRHSIS